MRHAVLKHPGRAGAVGNHFVDDLRIGARSDAERDRFRGGGDVHAGEELIDHFHLRSGAGLVAQFVHLGRNGFEHRAGFLEGRFGAGAHDGQLTLGGAGGAAGNRRIDQQQAFCVETFTQLNGEIRRDRAAGDDDGTLGERGGRAILAEQDFAGLVGVDDQNDDDRNIAPDIGRTFRRDAAFFCERLRHFRPHVVSVHFETFLEQRARHTQTHRTQSDHACLLLRACSHLVAPCFCRPRSLHRIRRPATLARISRSNDEDQIDHDSVYRLCAAARCLSQQPAL